MIIDFHAHTFPDELAPRAVGGLAAAAHMMHYSDGTVSGLLASMERAGIDVCLTAPVVTRPHQTESINRAAMETDAAFDGRGIISLGGIHPDTENPKRVLNSLAEAGVLGVKLHPLFQGTAIDDPRYLRIIERCAELGLLVLIHAGLDPDFPGLELSGPAQISNMLRAVPYNKIILAHLGALGQWDAAEELFGQDVYLDTACALYPWRDECGEIASHDEYSALTRERFTSIVRRHGAHRVLFGTDSPWTDQREARDIIESSGLTGSELCAVMGGSAAKLLGLEDRA